MKILIADDDKVLVHMLERHFAKQGWEVFAAHDALQSWMDIHRLVPDAVVLDMGMPAGNGMEVVRKMKSFSNTQDIPVLIMSAHPLLPDRLISSGADDFIAKPFKPAELFERVVRLTRPVNGHEQRLGEGGGAFKILVADDDATVRHSLEVLLTKWGYEVVTAPGGEEAWRLLQGDAVPPLAILDWMMPDIEGVEICRRLRSRINAAYTYVLLLTSKGDKEELVEAMDAGADAYIVKPFSPEELKVQLFAGCRLLGLQKDTVGFVGRKA